MKQKIRNSVAGSGLRFKVSSLKFKTDKLMALLIFIVLGFLALQVPINNLAGSGARFTLFDLFAPVSGAFLGSWIGVVAVFLMQFANMAFHGFAGIDKGAIIRLFPILFGVWFFAVAPNLSLRAQRSNLKRDSFASLASRAKRASLRMTGSWILIVPLLAIISFNLNPIGRSVWYYSLFWLIPFLAYPVVKRSLVARALASTFVAHSVGGAIWIWVFNLPASVWQGLIPVVALERGLMALGICASYILVNNLVLILKNQKIVSRISIDKNYIFPFRLK